MFALSVHCIIKVLINLIQTSQSNNWVSVWPQKPQRWFKQQHLVSSNDMKIMTLFELTIPRDFHCRKDPEHPHCHPKPQRWTTLPIFDLLNERNLITTANPVADMDHIDRASAAVISVDEFIPVWIVMLSWLQTWCHQRLTSSAVVLLQGSPGLVVTPLLKGIFTILYFYSSYIFGQ